MQTRKLLKQSAQQITRIPLVHREAGTFSFVAQVLKRKQLFRTLGIDLVLDVGANVGQYGNQIRKFYSGQIVSFEPVKHVYEQLKTRIADDKRWTAHQLALGSEDTTASINVAASSDFSSFASTNDFANSTFGLGARRNSTEQVTVRRLESLLPELVPDFAERRVFLKMDTQGWDLAVFDGLGELANCISAMQTEVSVIPIYKEIPHWTDAIQRYESRGFSISGMFPVNVVENRAIEMDCYLVRNSVE